MHAWPIFWLQNTKKVPITGESTYARGEIPAKKNICFFFLALRGVVLRADGNVLLCVLLLYAYTVRRMQVFSFRLLFCRSFYEMVYEMREKKKWAAGRIFYGEEKLGGWDLWVGETSHYP